MVFKFLVTIVFVPIAWLFAEAVFEVLLFISNKLKTKEKTLCQMLEDGDLETDVSFPDQYVLLGAIDQDGKEVQIEELDDEFDIVDIEHYRMLIENKKRASEVILEV